MTCEIEAIVSGRVQMVMFRDFVQRKARRLGLIGTVKNLPDGTVLVMAQGDEEKLKDLVARLHKGPVLSRVDAVKVTWRKPDAHFDSFEIVQ
jgi:acylphosphatase